MNLMELYILRKPTKPRPAHLLLAKLSLTPNFAESDKRKLLTYKQVSVQNHHSNIAMRWRAPMQLNLKVHNIL